MKNKAGAMEAEEHENYPSNINYYLHTKACINCQLRICQQIYTVIPLYHINIKNR